MLLYLSTHSSSWLKPFTYCSCNTVRCCFSNDQEWGRLTLYQSNSLPYDTAVCPVRLPTPKEGSTQPTRKGWAATFSISNHSSNSASAVPRQKQTTPAEEQYLEAVKRVLRYHWNRLSGFGWKEVGMLLLVTEECWMQSPSLEGSLACSGCEEQLSHLN